MRKFLMICLCFVCGIFAFGQVAISGNIFTGLRADISESAQIIYANEDANGTPIWANFRMDYSLDKNAGMTLAFRTKGTDAVSAVSSRFYPFLNRGFVWVKSLDGMFRARSGYLWDLDFETNGSAWDTASTYEWTTELVAFPFKDLEVGMVIPTPYNKADLVDSLKNITYGFVYSPANFRFSAMGEYGSVDANRSINFGIDYTGVTNFTARVEGDLQQVGIADVGYYNIGQYVSYKLGAFTPTLSVYEIMYKDGSPTKVTITASDTFVDKAMTYYGEFVYSADTAAFGEALKKVKLSAQMAINTKSNVKIGSYVSMPFGEPVVVSPFVQFFASF
jgi:hypothetical protein